MMNLLQQEDMVKGLPDDRLMQEAKAPSGDIPQFLFVSEIQRRTNMRKSAEQQMAEQPEGTITDQTLREAGGMDQPPPPQMPPQQPQIPQTPPPNMPYPLPGGQGLVPSQQQFPPMQDPNAPIAQGMAAGGPVRGSFPASRGGLTYPINATGYPTQQVAYEEFLRGNNPPAGIPGYTAGITDNITSFSPTGDLIANADMVMPESVQQGILSAIPAERYKAAFEQQVRPSNSREKFTAESLAKITDPIYDIMGSERSVTPKWDEHSGFNPLQSIQDKLVSREADPALVQRAEDLLNPAPVEPSMTANAELMGDRPMPKSIYDRHYDKRQEYFDEGKLQTLDKIAGNTLSGFDRGTSEGTVQAWIDSNVEKANDPTLARTGGLGSMLESMGEEGYLGRVSESMYGGDIGDALFGAYDTTKEAVSRIPEYINTQDAIITRKLKAVAPEKIEQMAAADPISKDNSRSRGDPAPSKLDTLREGIASLGTETGGYAGDGQIVDALDTTDLAAQARKAAWGNALVQLGAGIAGGDLQAGLRNAGIATSRGLEDTRRLDLIGKQSEITRQREQRAFDARERDAEFNRTARKLGLEIQMEQVDAMAERSLSYERKQEFYEMKNTLELLTKQKADDLIAIDSMSEEEAAALDKSIEDITARIISMTAIKYGSLEGT